MLARIAPQCNFGPGAVIGIWPSRRYTVACESAEAQNAPSRNRWCWFGPEEASSRAEAPPPPGADSMNLSALPSVDSLLMTPEARHLLDRVPRALVVEALRHMLAKERQRLRRGNDLPESSETLTPSALVTNASAWINQEFDPGIPKVINATGVVLHTNLGRAPLAPQAIQALVEAARPTPGAKCQRRIAIGWRDRVDPRALTRDRDLTINPAGRS